MIKVIQMKATVQQEKKMKALIEKQGGNQAALQIEMEKRRRLSKKKK